jgi:hypothetical protein
MVICIRDYTTSVCRYTAFETNYNFFAGKTYRIIYDNNHTIQIIDDDGYLVSLTKDDIGMGFAYHFKYLSEIRDNKLKQLGI